MFLALDLDAPPSLAMGFADYRAHETLALVATDGFDPRVDTLEEIDVGGGADLDAERIRRRHRLGKIGVTCMIAGASGVVVGTTAFAVALVASFGGSGGVGTGIIGLTGLGIAVLGGAAYTTGEVLMFTGGIGAAKLLGESTTVGWVGVGLAIGAFGVSTVASVSGVEELVYVSPLLSIGGVVCGAVQLAQSGHAGREAGVISLIIAPSPNGIRVGGTF